VLDVDVARELHLSATIFAYRKLPFTDTLGAIALLSNAAKGFSATGNFEAIIHLSSAVVRLLLNAAAMLLFGALGVWHRMG